MRFTILILLVAFAGCKSRNTMKQVDGENTVPFVPQYTPGPQAIVYKTKNDYHNLVPVLLSDDKSEIVSYPHPKDLKAGDEYMFPASLNNGYLFDNRGIGSNVAFLKYTYQEYSEFSDLPDLKDLYDSIVDKEPLTELCDCGNRTAFSDVTKQLNQLIDHGMLRTTCRVVK